MCEVVVGGIVMGAVGVGGVVCCCGGCGVDVVVMG